MDKLAILLLGAFALCTNADKLEDVKIHLDLLEMDIEDKFDPISLSETRIVLNKTGAFEERLGLLKDLNEFVHQESKDLLELYDMHGLDLTVDLQRKWNILYKTGDVKLPTDDWNKFINFQMDNDKIIRTMKVPCAKKSKGCTKEDVINVLASSRNITELQSIWSAKQELFLSHGKDYQSILNLVSKSAKANDFNNFLDYWENLVEYPDAYSTAKSLWQEIKPLYVKIHDFVKLRLEQKYKQTFTNIPVYLLGSDFGDDWSNVADIVLPHRYLYDEILATLNHDKVGGRKLYEYTRKLTGSLYLDDVGKDFWDKSIFNHSCPSRLFIFPGDKYTQIITCNKTGWAEYLNAHENMVRAGLIHSDYSNYVYTTFRTSALDEALVGLSTLLALKNLPLAGIVSDDIIEKDKDNDIDATALLLTALRVLPRLPYYLLADSWRMEQLEGESQDIVLSWWEERESIQMVKGFKNNEWDLLGDKYMTSNKPYIGKFLGTILQFQLLEHFESNGDGDVNILSRIHSDESYKNMLKHRGKDSWVNIMNNDLNIYDVSADALLEYFKPLEEYINRAPLTQVTQTVVPRTTTPIPTTQPPTTTTETKFVKDEPVSEKAKLEPKEAKPDIKSIINKIMDAKAALGEGKGKEEVPVKEETSSGSAAVWIGSILGVSLLGIVSGLVVRRKCQRPSNNRSFSIIYEQELIEMD